MLKNNYNHSFTVSNVRPSCDVVFSCRYCNWEKVFLPLYMLNRFHAQGIKKTFVISGSNFWLSNNFVRNYSKLYF